MKKLTTMLMAAIITMSTQAIAAPMMDGIDSDMTRNEVIQKYDGTKRYVKGTDVIRDFAYYKQEMTAIVVKYTSRDETATIKSMEFKAYKGLDEVKTHLIQKYGQPISESTTREFKASVLCDRYVQDKHDMIWTDNGMTITLSARQSNDSLCGGGWKLKMSIAENNGVNL